MKRKVCVVVTARPSYSRIKTALRAIQEHPELELQLVVAASALLERYGNAVDQIESDGFNINAKIYMVVEGENLVTSAKSTGFGLAELATVLDNLRPDVVVTIADRYETIATAIAASFMNIPLAHIQGGEVTGSIDEKVRHAITKLSDLHFVSTERAAERVTRMGEDPNTVFVTGCPSIDLAAEVMDEPNSRVWEIINERGVGAKLDLKGRDYVVVMQHPVTTEYKAARAHVTETLHAVKDSGLPAIWFWPNVDAGSDGTSKGIRMFREQHDLPNAHFLKNLDPKYFLKLLANSLCIIGNSSVGIRECSFLGVPAINIGTRQQGRERGANVIDCPIEKQAILAAIEQVKKRPRPDSDRLYGAGASGREVANLLAKVDLSIEKRLAY